MSDFNDAWIKFQKDHPETFNATGLKAPKEMNQFLENRLHRAFSAGYSAGQADLRQACKRKLADILDR